MYAKITLDVTQEKKRKGKKGRIKDNYFHRMFLLRPKEEILFFASSLILCITFLDFSTVIALSKFGKKGCLEHFQGNVFLNCTKMSLNVRINSFRVEL